ncbi:binding-protein-dependent transporters inner membrane component [Halococcus morrhuae DSM 1307]|uniref:Binding-protein-dependent transporters inner membrane component n=2 Tax=Halococcus TaxID=2249 RepID=M0MG93_HALMO|nr:MULTISPECIES: ABC transporter permease [Halococcus]EMA44368.1 binding-protein-dependent transporters inner membrane component [Halococcus morrhuae DSM 1307]UOO95574.1 ABC transporter permease [Halococcus dombrowskii]
MSETQSDEEVPLRDRIAANPRPALQWLAGAIVLLAVEFGAFIGVIIQLALTVVRLLPSNPGAAALASAGEAAESIPTLLTRGLIPNQGYQTASGEWMGTFLGLEPAYAWLLRVVLIYAYAFVWLGWFWVGYRWFRDHYRYADWTPRDDVVDRLRSHRWGQFGFVLVLAFFVLALFAPALGPTTVDANIQSPYTHYTKYYDDEIESVSNVTVGTANLGSTSQGAGGENVGPWSYDDYGRFHPFGTLTDGKDLFTFMAAGARISLMIGLVSLMIAGFIATALAMLTAYYKGLADLAAVITSDSIQSLPVLLVLILASAVFGNTWIANLYNGAVLLIAIFSVTYWPFFWRALRGPALQISEQEWIDAAKSFGQKPRVIMQKHMFPYVVGYLLIYASLTLGGIIIAVAGLSYLGLGITPPTPEWGRAISAGQPYVATASWHISLIPGIMITLIVVGFNALGDGIRDALDPQSEGGEETGGEAAVAGGGGA